MSLSFVKEGDNTNDSSASATTTTTPALDSRPLAVILQANREAKEAAMEAKLKAMNQQLTLTDDDLAFMASREQAQLDRLAAAKREEQLALAAFRNAVSERVLVSVTEAPVAATAMSSVPAAVSAVTESKKRSADVVAPPVPADKKPLVSLHQPTVLAVKKKARVGSTTNGAPGSGKKPAASSAGLSLLGAYGGDDSESSN
jgi:hypothetical protein